MNFSHLIGMLSFKNLNSLIWIFVFPVTQFPDEPRAPDDDVENAFIDDMFENNISDLLYVNTPGFIQNGSCSYARLIRSMISIAVDNLFAQINIFFSGNNVAKYTQNTVYDVVFPVCLALSTIERLLLTI